METLCILSLCFYLLLKLHQLEEVHGLPNWDSLFTENTLSHQFVNDMNNLHGEGEKEVPWSLNPGTR